MDEKLVVGSGPPRATTPLAHDNYGVPSSEGEANVESREVGSPTSGPCTTNTLARFEFEIGRGNEGSKVLMVEWDCSCAEGPEFRAQDREGWEVMWEGKSATYPLNDDDENSPSIRRVYFLLPENAPVPPEVTIFHSATGNTLTTKCMPAIFAPGLGVSLPDSGRRGVLHTIWAKKRLAELQAEIDKELQFNSEGVALEMAIQERGWVIDHFGFVDLDTQERQASSPAHQSSRSPVGGRIGEMLKGLKLTTSSSDLAKARGALNATPVPNISAPRPSPGPTIASLDAVIGNSQPVVPVSQARDTEDELFALPMSPRSPEMRPSPFSMLK
ncbi:hypothetical protein GGS21DRAFT_94400 [Xylaria nigripes]|nr:hypothetical protein GGS21DRAFT_94400 [Xylaria nigripes]